MGEIFEANHGKGSWKKFLKEWNAIRQEGGETEVEYMECMSDLSSISITKQKNLTYFQKKPSRTARGLLFAPVFRGFFTVSYPEPLLQRRSRDST